jgi:hypothetical protein
LPAPIYDAEARPLSGYSVVNVIRCIDALADPLVSVDKMVLNEARIPSDAHLFRIVSHETLLIASEEMVEEVTGKSLQGIAFIKTKSVKSPNKPTRVAVGRLAQ